MTRRFPELFAGGLLWLVLSLVTPTLSHGAEPAIHVSPQGDDRWSGRSAASTPDGRDGPVATLARAVEEARKRGLRLILLRGGTHRLADTVTLGPEDSGLRIAAFPGETPVLSGGEAVTGFKTERDGIVSAPLAREPGLDVTAAGVRLRAAQSGAFDPHDPIRSGWFIAQQTKGGGDKRQFRFPPGTVQAGWAAPGVRVQALDRERQADDIRGIERIDRNGTLVLDRDGWYPFRDGSTFRLLGHPDFLKFPGQFAWSARDRRLLVRPQDPDGFVRSGEAVVARTAPLIQADKADSITIDGLSFADVPYNGAAVRLAGGTGHRVLNNRFSAVGTGVLLVAASDSEVRGNSLEHLGRSGIELTPGSAGNRVVANTIHHIGEVNFYGAGILTAGVTRTLIAHNDIRHAARYGISMKNWNAETKNVDNVIEYNRIRDVGRETADLGAIETLGRSDIDTKLVIRFNDIRGTGGLATDAAGRWLTRYKGFGIYLDDQTNGVRVEGNFLEDTGWASVFIHGGDGNRVENNIAVLTNERDRFLRFEWVPKAGTAGFLHDNEASRNIIHARVPVEQMVTALTGGDYRLENNIFDRPGRGLRAPGAPMERTQARSIQGGNLPDPYFMNPAKDDYRLRPNSPAFKIGFQELPWARIGPEGAR
ncbi:right-handed parallel beta-helix repeat-containing protein [Roseomonas genomospecies 6]|uniref:Right-handed parallel beta-helix repeat-containing protein n=1 Tax=Roseomonas genomospecies 6 TaxID=214106 RepID=A0A9W7NKY9_9PROT|nr:right-handed parallel beta-helix repeat-containing protein [Roseomonas genomospecies 6]KAA0681793.1 right-handed parallel beta-helix repeat-containing protein [Roseomonas genomospecies 6]